MSEVVAAERWLYGVLNSDATLKALTPGVYSLPIPAGAALPATLFNNLAAEDLMALGPHRVWVNGLWIVRAVFEARSWGGNLEAAANRIDVLLQASSGVVTGGQVWACVRERPFQLIENHAGQELRHLGGVYRIFVT